MAISFLCKGRVSTGLFWAVRIRHLECAALVLFGVGPRAESELHNKHLAGFGEHDRRFRADHAHALVELHDFLDAGKRELELGEVLLQHELGVPTKFGTR
jgi:hypothetical protein